MTSLRVPQHSFPPTWLGYSADPRAKRGLKHLEVTVSEQQLPLPDYDELPLASISHRIRALSEDQLRTLIEHEREHAHRVPVLEVLNSRFDELERGARPSQGDQTEATEAPRHSRSGSSVSPTAPAESGRPVPHGTRGNTGKGIEHSE